MGKKYGEIPPQSIILAHTGWDKYWDQEKYCLVDDSNNIHYPGYSKEAADLLVKRKIHLAGIDTTGIDHGCSKKAPAHQAFLKEEIILVEGLANLDKLSPTGIVVYLLPMKIQGEPEAPIRAIAFYE